MKGRIAAWAVAGTALVAALFPVYWVVLTAFRPRGEIFSHPVSLLPRSLSLDSLSHVWFGTATEKPVLGFLFTSAVVAAGATVLAVACGTACAYAMARRRVGGRAFSMWVLSQRFMPPIALIVPLFMVFREAGLLDSHAGLILLYTAFNIPLAVWLMLGFIESVPAEVEEAALMDGATPFQAFRKAVLPLLKPGLAVTAIFTFIFSWNEFLFAYQLAGNRTATYTVYLPNLRSAIAELYGEIAAASLLSVLPALGFAWVMQKHLVQGLTLGGGREQ